MAYRISPDFRLGDYPHEVGRLWRSRNDEPEQQVFDRLPRWMNPQHEDRDTRIDLERLIPAILETMTHREQALLWCRFWGDYTLDEVGMCFGVTRERVRQIEAKAIRRLKHPSRSDKLSTLVEYCPIKMRQEREEAEIMEKWWKEKGEKEMEERHAKYMENRLIEKLLALKDPTN